MCQKKNCAKKKLCVFHIENKAVQPSADSRTGLTGSISRTGRTDGFLFYAGRDGRDGFGFLTKSVRGRTDPQIKILGRDGRTVFGFNKVGTDGKIL